MFYKLLKRDREFNNPRWPFLIKVRDVEGKVMIDATFKHRSQGQQGRLRRGHPGQDARAPFRPRREGRPRLLRRGRDPALRQRRRRHADQQRTPGDPDPAREPVQRRRRRSRNITNRGARCRAARRTQTDHRHGAETAGDQGRASSSPRGGSTRINWWEVKDAFGDHAYRCRRCNELETEWQLRISMALRQPAVRDPGGAGRNPVRQARLPERVHHLLRADHHACTIRSCSSG